MYMLQKSRLDGNGSICLIETVSLALGSAAADAFFVLGVRAERSGGKRLCVYVHEGGGS